MMNRCGLITVQKEPVPLQSIEVELEVRDHVATVVSTLKYQNKEDKPVEAVFVFPLPGDAAVCHFSAVIGQKEIVAEVKEKQEAREEYDDALSSGQQAFLLEESEQSPDIFSMKVGGLAPGESASIRLEYVTELAVQADDGLRFCLPAVLNPRYQPQGRNTSTLMGDPVVMVSLYPEFPQSVMSSVASCGEFVFLLDRSGSMDCSTSNSREQETRISSARDTLLLLLKSLPMGCYFNIYSFGSSYEHIFPQSVEYSEKSMEEALKKVKGMEADLGGTEILEPLKHIYSQRCIPSQPRQLFVFTDGEVGNTKEVLDVVKKNSGSHRCFSFGIGEGASSALINGLAKEGGGHAQFITGTDRMQPKVIQSLRFALQPAVEDISVTWGLPKGLSVTVLSPPITSIFQGQRSLIYGQLTGQATEGSVTVKYSLAGRPSQNQLHFSLKPAEDTGLTVHRLAARTLIRSLEMEDRDEMGETDGGIKEKVVQLSVQSGVSSSFTAFIAVNKDNNETIQGPLVRRDIPVASECHFSKFLLKIRKARCGCCMFQNTENLQFDFDKFSVSHMDALHQDHAKIFVELCVEEVETPQQTPRDPLLQLVSLQKASGCWILDPDLAAALGKTSEEVEKSKPVTSEVWATILALIWLHGFKMDAKEEWELLAMKAASWLCAQNGRNLIHKC
uniref:von Willebrand factor A domain-containing protein 5A-like n=1 Tax=Amphiprion ocellaris TaxID=80972 RepID=A0AAQ6AIA4_AMPOC